MVILENIDIDIVIDKAILPNIDIDKISNRFPPSFSENHVAFFYNFMLKKPRQLDN